MPTYKVRFEIDLEVDAKDVFEAKKIAEERIAAHVEKNPPDAAKIEVVKRPRT
jgi:hypothetical protein